MRYKEYEEYKDSGVECLGKVPQHWIKSKISRVFDIISSGGTPKSSNELYYENGEINWLLTGDLNDGYIEDTSKKITKLAVKENSILREYKKNSLVMAMYGATIGKLGVTNIETTTNQACCVMSEPKDCDIKYMFYWFLGNRREIINLSQGGGQPNISQDIVKSLSFYKPTFQEQEKIVEFLDKKTSEIDKLIEEKEKLIELLKEKREAIITEAVTKGLDKNVKMKDSGVEWIGEIPENWRLSKIKYISDINSCTLNENTSEDFTFKYVDIGSVNSFGELCELEEMKFEKAPSRARRIVKSGDSIISTVRTYLKAITSFGDIEDNSIVCSTGFAVLTPKKEVVSEYLSYLVRNQRFIEQIVKRSTGVSYPAITSKEIGDLEIIIPNIYEQQKISNYLKIKNDEYKVIINNIEKQVEKLKEYKKSLISEVVTGKIDVRNEL